jgi:hypothetical protein
MSRARVPTSGGKARRAPEERAASPRIRRRRKTARVAVRKGATLLEMSPPPHEIPGVLKRKRPIR